MTEITTQPVDASSIPAHSSAPAVALVHPEGHGKYAALVSYCDGMVALTVRYVERPWLPLSVFGRVVETKLVRLGGESVREMSMTNDAAAGLWCAIARMDGAVERISLLGAQWPAALRESVRADVDAAVHRKAGGFSINVRGRTATVAALIVAYALISGLSGSKQPAAIAAGTAAPVAEAPTARAPVAHAGAAPALSPNEAAAMSSAAFAQAAADAQPSPMPVKEALSKASFINLRAPGAGGKNLVIWSDPLCPHCRDFEQKVLDKLPATLGVTIVPVAFKHGARPILSYAACASTAAERGARWKNLMSEQPTGIDVAQQCETGPAIADSNSALFARAGLRSTPTLMKPDGQVFDGDVNSVEAVTSWLAK